MVEPRKIPAISSTSNIKDDNTRKAFDSFLAGWRVRNGEVGKGDEAFITRAQLTDIIINDNEFLGNLRTSLRIPPILNSTNDDGFGPLTPEFSGLFADLLADLLSDFEIPELPDNIANEINDRLLSEVDALVRRINEEADARIAANIELARQLAETSDRLAEDIFNEAVARENAIIATRDALTAVISGETSARIEGDNAIATSVSDLAARTENSFGAVRDRIDVIVSTQNSEVTRLSALSAKVDDNSASIIDERNARVNADGALAERIDSTVVQFNDQIAAVQTTVTANATQLETVAQQIDRIIVVDEGQAADIELERNARIAADEAQAEQLLGLGARVDQNAADLVEERRVRANADSAQAERVDALTTRVGDNAAAIVTNAQASADRDSALSVRLDAVTARTNDNQAAIINEATARANGDSANAQSINGLTSRVGNAEADILTLRQTDADNFQASIREIDQRIANFNNNTVQAGFSQERDARVNADNAITNFVNQEFAKTNNNVAQFDSRINTATNTANAASQKVDTISSKVDNNSIAIQTEQQTRANADGQLFAQYTVKVSNNGVVSGFGLASSANNATPTSAFIIAADEFAVVNPSDRGFTTNPNPDNVPFAIVGGRTFIKQAAIGEAYIDTLRIRQNTIFVTAIHRANTSATFNTSFQTVQTINFSVAQVDLNAQRVLPTIITATMQVAPSNGDATTLLARLLLNGSEQERASVTFSGDAIQFAVQGLTFIPGGSNSLQVQMAVTNAAGGTTSKFGAVRVVTTFQAGRR